MIQTAPDLPDVLLDYQKEQIAALKEHDVVVEEKSRRIGATWGFGADAVLTSASDRSDGGMDTFYIGYNRDMTREFIDTCAMWSKSLLSIAVEVGEFLFPDQTEDGADRSIQAFRISYNSGFDIVALCSRPRSLRGRQGKVIIDEAAFHDDLKELLKAALALLIWGGKVLVISSHNGVDNPFNQLCEEIRSKPDHPYKLLRVTFDDALAQGLYKRICYTRGIPWSKEAEEEWARSIRELYGDAASEELDCIPKNSGGKYISRTLLMSRAKKDIPILRWTCDDEFVHKEEGERQRVCDEWCRDNLGPLLVAMNRERRSFVGGDFARSGDLSVFWPLSLSENLDRLTPFLIELRNVPFRQQEQILFYLCDRLPRFSGGAFDARGNGQHLSELALQRYGADRISPVMLSEGWYRDNMPPLKAAFEDSQIDLPADSDVVDDFRTLEVVRGVARIVERTSSGDGQRHGDAAIAAALAYFASRVLDGGPITFRAEGRIASSGAVGDADEDTNKRWSY